MRRFLGWFCACVMLAIASAAPAAAAPVQSPTAAPTGAWILVDADTGAVLDAASARIPMRPASVSKVLTALIAAQQLPAAAQVPVSARAASMPAMKINMQAGQVWPLSDALRSLLMVSANDAAAAIAERVGGSLEGFADVMNRAAVRLRLEDGPVLQDPAGLDDEFSVRGGNLISARDLAIITRAALAVPIIRTIVSTPEYRFQGVDGLSHHLPNHNRLLRRYPGAIGVKTGYTRRAGSTLIAAASRNGRTMIAIVLRAKTAYDTTSALLDHGFATPVSSETGLDRLPAVGTTGSLGTAASSAAVNAKAATSKPIVMPTNIETVAQGDQEQVEPPAGSTETGKRNFEVPQLGAIGAVLLLGVLPAAWIMFVARPRNRRRKQRERQRQPQRKRYQHRRLPLLSLFFPRLRKRRKRRHAARPPTPTERVSPPRRPEDGPFPPISTASSLEDPLLPSRFDALVRERVAR